MRLSRLASSERGAVLVVVSAAMFALVLLAAFVVDAANWYEHKRHLQLQADAAALAGAHSFTLGSCSDSLIMGDAHRYGGSYSPDGTTVYPEPYNNQIGGTAPKNVHVLINSAAYYGDAGAGDNTDTNGSPCTAKYIDIKATETNLPWFFGFGGLVPKINAHARVGLVQENQATGTLPIAVPNPLPTSAAAIFIDEANGDAILSAVPLSHVGTSGSLDMWSNGSAPAAVTNPSRATGIVIVLSGRQAASFSLSGGLTAICNQALTDCYDASSDPPTNGVSFIRGYSAVGSGAQPAKPILRSVELFPGTTGSPCSNPYFASNTSDCTYDFVARIDAGTNLPKANQIYAANGIGLTSSTDPNCAYVAGADQCWHANLTLTAKSGANPITVTWEETSGCLDSTDCASKSATVCTTRGGNKCKGTFDGPAQRAYSAKDSTSGPIKLVNLCNTATDPSCATSDSQSYPAGSNLHLVVTVGIGGTLKNATDTGDPLVSLRIKSNTGQSLDCDPGYRNLKQELANGCRPSYIPNTGTPDCSTVGTSALWGSPQPWSCVAVNTGRAPNDVAAGLNLRIYGDEKPPNNFCPSPGLGTLGYNNWSMFVNGYSPTGPGDPRGQDGFPVGDPRVLDAYITTYGAFSHVNGTSGSVPVIGFGHFYVTGYTGNGQGFDPPNTCNSEPVPNNDSGLIVGHFIRYIDTVGGTGTAPCDPNSINACVIVMTK